MKIAQNKISNIEKTIQNEKLYKLTSQTFKNMGFLCMLISDYNNFFFNNLSRIVALLTVVNGKNEDNIFWTGWCLGFRQLLFLSHNILKAIPAKNASIFYRTKKLQKKPSTVLHCAAFKNYSNIQTRIREKKPDKHKTFKNNQGRHLISR